MAAAADSWFTIDRDYRITATNQPLIRAYLGQNLWEAFPGSEPEYRPIYEQAWANGHASGAGFHAGTLAHVEAVATEDLLRVEIINLERLDAVTMDRLIESLERIRAALENDRRARIEGRGPLRLVTQDG